MATPTHPPMLPYLRGMAGDLLRRGTQEYRAREIPDQAEPPPGTLMATWLGTAGLFLDDGQTRLFIDPFVSAPSLARLAVDRPIQPDQAAIERWVERLGASPASAVLVSHSHYDHAMDAPGFALASGADLFGSSSTVHIGIGGGLPAGRAHRVVPREPLRFGAFEVIFLPSVHGPCPIGDPPHAGHVTRPLVPPAPYGAWRHGDTWVLWVRHPAGSFIHQGSADTLPDTLDGVKAELSMACLVWRRSTADLLQRAVEPVGATRLIPLHADDMFLPIERGYTPMPGADVAGFFRDMAELSPKLQIDTLPLGDPRPLFPSEEL